MDFKPTDLIKYYNARPSVPIKRALKAFFHTRFYREAKKFFKIKSIIYVFCKSKTQEALAYYVMGTKHKPVIVLHDKIMRKFSKKHLLNLGKKREKAIVYVTMLHEMAHAYLDWKGLHRQSEDIVNAFALKAVKCGVKPAMKILYKYLKRRGR